MTTFNGFWKKLNSEQRRRYDDSCESLGYEKRKGMKRRFHVQKVIEGGKNITLSKHLDYDGAKRILDFFLETSNGEAYTVEKL